MNLSKENMELLHISFESKKNKLSIVIFVMIVGIGGVFSAQVANASEGPGSIQCSGGLNILGVGWEHSVTCGAEYLQNVVFLGRDA